jgi:hypothetical protein
MGELDFVGWNNPDWTGVFAHYHTDGVNVDWQGQTQTHGIEEHIQAMKSYVEQSGGGTPPQITSHPIHVRVRRVDVRRRRVRQRCPYGDRSQMARRRHQ